MNIPVDVIFLHAIQTLNITAISCGERAAFPSNESNSS